jgi:hemolysin III
MIAQLTPRQPHYPTPSARMADLIVHIAGLSLAIVFGAILVGLSAGSGKTGLIIAVAVYAFGLIAMLSFSTVYNFARARFQERLKPLDHAGIFLMIAASYTPFTTQGLEGPWAWGMTLAIWTLAAFGIIGKLTLQRLSKRFWVSYYILLGWLVVIAMEPLSRAIDWVALLLLALGGLVYTLGVIFHVNRRLTFSKAIWHGHVVTAAGLHWTAVLLGVVLAAK